MGTTYEIANAILCIRIYFMVLSVVFIMEKYQYAQLRSLSFELSNSFLLNTLINAFAAFSPSNALRFLQRIRALVFLRIFCLSFVTDAGAISMMPSLSENPKNTNG